MEVTDELLGKGDNVALFLFNDTLELCKRRGTARSQSSSVKSPSVTSIAKTPTKSFKHLEILPLAHIKVLFVWHKRLYFVLPLLSLSLSCFFDCGFVFLVKIGLDVVIVYL